MGTSRIRSALFGLGIVAATTAMVGVTPVAATTSSPNLLKNGTAEAAAGGTGQTVPVPGWTRTNGHSFTAVKYGSPGFPKVTAPAPPNRGKNFFAGGSQLNPDNQVASQTVSLSKYVPKIKGGHVTLTAAGWFGGKGNEGDTATLEVDFKNGQGGLIGSGVSVGGVTAAQRNNKTELLHRIRTIAVPKGARSLFVQAIFDDIPCTTNCPDVADTYNNGYADNMTVVLNNV